MKKLRNATEYNDDFDEYLMMNYNFPALKSGNYFDASLTLKTANPESTFLKLGSHALIHN